MKLYRFLIAAPVAVLFVSVAMLALYEWQKAIYFVLVAVLLELKSLHYVVLEIAPQAKQELKTFRGDRQNS